VSNVKQAQSRGQAWDRALRTWGSVAAMGLFVVILIGFLDTFTHSAEGCGAVWPLCNGRLVPGPGLHSEVEYWHRAITGAVGLLVGVIVIWAWRRFWRYREVVLTGVIGLGFVVVQALVGAAAVLWPESPPVMATHFGFALLAFAGFALMVVLLFQLAPDRQQTGYELRRVAIPSRLRFGVVAAMAYTVGIAYWGAYVAHVGAGLGCTGWPLCNGAVVPAFAPGVAVVMIHRLAAVGILGWVGWLFALVRVYRQQRPDLYRALHIALAVVVLQIFSGAAVVLSGLNTSWDIVHVSLMTILFTVMAYLTLQVWPPATLRAAPLAAGAARH
jgi:cytochrome c oxidase assembly protein subunit 15